MVGSMNSLDFCTECPITEKNAVPLDCWNDICLSDIWIPSNLLPNRNKPKNTKTRGIFHTLEKKDASKYINSFSVYTLSDDESGQGEIFISDSEEDIFESDSVNFERIEMLPNGALPTVADPAPSLSNTCNINTENYSEIDTLSKSSEVSDYGMLNPQKNLTVIGKTSLNLGEIPSNDGGKYRKIINSKVNLLNNRKDLEEDQNEFIKNLSKSDINESGINISASKESHKVNTDDFENVENVGKQTTRKANKDSDSVISLNEILDVTTEINIKDFECDFKKKDDSVFLNACGKQEKSSKKSKKDKSKKKASKYITLDKFLEDRVDVSQDYYCDKYFQNIFGTKCKSGNFSNVPVESKTDFPDLGTEEFKFIHSDKTIKERNSEVSSSNLSCSLNNLKEIYKNENDAKEIRPSEADTMFGKIIIENIPLEVTKDDILIILCGYGEIKNISLVSVGNFLKAYVEIDLICDIDWIIECLNGSEPFGASSKMLRCYKQ